jgi:hypothetical protein
MTNEELVEKAARLLGAGDPLPSEYELARDVVNMVLEEAAKVAQFTLMREPGGWPLREMTAEEIAAAIRALKSEPANGKS